MRLLLIVTLHARIRERGRPKVTFRDCPIVPLSRPTRVRLHVRGMMGRRDAAMRRSLRVIIFYTCGSPFT